MSAMPIQGSAAPSLLARHPALLALRSVGTWWALASVLDDVPADDVEPGLGAAAQVDREFGDTAGAASRAAFAGIVADALDHGLVAAFDRRRTERGALLAPELRTALAAVEDPVRAYLAADDPSGLAGAEAAWIALVRSRAVETHEPAVRLSLLLDAVRLHRLMFDGTGDPGALDSTVGLAEHAVGLWRHVEGPPPACLLELDGRLVDLTARWGAAALERHRCARAPQDLALAERALTSAVQMTAPAAPERALRLGALAQAVGARPDREAAAAAAALLSDAIAAEPEDSDGRAMFERARSAFAGRDGPGPDGARAAAQAHGLWQRFVAEGDLDVLAEAVEIAREAAQLGEPNVLGAILQTRYEALGHVEDLDEAVTVLETAVDRTALRPADERAGVRSNLAAALRTRYARLRDPKDIDRALHLVREAAALADGSPPEVEAITVTTLAAVLHDRHRAGAAGSELDEAIGLWERALALQDAPAPDVVFDLAIARTARARRDGTPDDLQDAIAALEDLVAENEPAAAWPAYAGELASALEQRDGPGDRARATGLARRAVGRGLEASADLALRVAYDWGGRAMRRGMFAEAAEAHGQGVEAVRRLAGAQAARRAKVAWLREAAGVPTSAAYALTRTGDPVDAVLALERGRGVLLAEALGTDERRPDSLAWPQLRAAADPPIAFLVAAEPGGVALVVEAASDAPDVVWLDTLDEARVRALANRLQDGHRARATDPGGWSTALDAVLDGLRGALAPLVAAHGDRRVVLVPTGLLSMLPVAAVWPQIASLAPTALALAAARDSRREPGTGGLLAVAEPAPVDAPALPHAAAEVAAAVHAVGGTCRVLSGEEATADAVASLLEDAAVVHLACHAHSVLEDPRRSGLLLARGERLGVERLAALRGLRAALVVLSACETGLPGRDAPDEAIGLATALLAASADAVVASLWTVDDTATMILMARFYELWRFEGQDGASALAGAQRWLRDTTNAEQLDHWERSFVAGRLPDETHRAIRLELVLREPDERAFAAARHWAAFSYMGAW